MAIFIRVRKDAPEGYTTAVHDVNWARVELGVGDYCEVRETDAKSYVNNYSATLERIDTSYEAMEAMKNAPEEPTEDETPKKKKK